MEKIEVCCKLGQFHVALEADLDISWDQSGKQNTAVPSQSEQWSQKTSQNGYKIVVRGETFYRSNIGRDLSIFKKTKSVADINPSVLPMGIKVKQTKLNDVNDLLKKHYGTDWQNLPHLKFYKHAVFQHNSLTDQECGDDPICEFRETIPDLRVGYYFVISALFS